MKDRRYSKCRICCHFMWATLVFFSLSHATHGQNLPEAEPSVHELYKESLIKKRLAAREIHQSSIPILVEDEVTRITRKLDSLFQEEMQERFATHYKEVEQSLQIVSLPEDTGSLELAIKQWKAGLGFDPSDLENLTERFIRQMQTTIEPQREDLTKDIGDRIYENLNAELRQAQDTIRKPLQEIVVRHFPAWDTPPGIPPVQPPPLPTSTLPSLQGENWSEVPKLALFGSALLISKWISEKITRKIVGNIRNKLLGKVLGSVGSGPWIIIIGIGSIVSEFFDIIQVKTNLEHNLRAEFLTMYKNEFSSATIWNQPVEENELSTRRQLEEEIRTYLHDSSRHYHEEMDQMLKASYRVVALSPNIRNYIAKETQKGRDTQQISEQMLLVGEVFGDDLIHQTPIRKLLEMIVDAPDRQELALLAGELGDWLLHEYDKHGREVLVAANLLGVPVVFLEVVQGRKLDWYDVRTTFERYPRDLSEMARRGLLLALEEQTAPSGVKPATLENIARNEQLFRISVTAVTPDTDKLFSLFGSQSVVEVVDQIYQKNAELAQAFLNQWSVQTWTRYRDPDRFDALLGVADYRLTDRNQAARDFAREIGARDDLTRIFADVGRCGVQLWDTYAGPATGQHQRQEAEKAIDFFKAGYPCEVLQTREGLNEIEIWHSLPFGLGLPLFDKIRPLVKSIYYVMIACVLLVVVVFVGRLLRKPGRPDTAKQKQKKDETVPWPSRLTTWFRSTLRNRSRNRNKDDGTGEAVEPSANQPETK